MDQFYLFPSVKVKRADKYMSAQRATCVDCGYTDDVFNNSAAHKLSIDLLRKKFMQRGWTIHGNETRCRNCSQSKHLPYFKKEAVMATEPVRLSAVATVVHPDRLAKRRIIEAIQAVWDDGRGR